MATHSLLNNFTGGEISPLLWGRTDLEKYPLSCRYLENFIPLPYGGVRRRPGSIFVAAAKTTSARLVPFRYSVTTNFIIELGYYSSASYMRFFTNHAQVLSGGTPYEIVAPYSSLAEIRTVQFRQINDIMYLVCPTKPVYKLSRLADTNWTLAEVSWDWPAMRDENVTSTTLAISDATVGTGRTLTASASTFAATHVGAYFQLSHLRDAASTSIGIGITTGTAESSSITVKGPWSLVTTERWYGELQLQRSLDNGTSWEVIRRFKSAADRNVNATGNEEDECIMKLYFVSAGNPYGTDTWAGTAPTDYVKAKATLECESAYVDGLVKVTGFTSATVVTASVLVACGSTAATKYWREGAWSAYRGYPRTVGFFEQSLVFGGTISQPNYIWKSKIGDFEDFYPSDQDDASVTYQAASVEQNPINWLDGQQRLLVGTANQELAFFSSNDEPLTPTNVSVRTQSNYGAIHKPAVPINDVLLFVERASNHLREMSFDVVQDSYVAPDLSLLAEHLFAGVTVLEVVVARLPEPSVFISCSDGILRVLTYNREQNITAWSRWTAGGSRLFGSVASIYGTDTDEVWTLLNGAEGEANIVYFADSTPSSYLAAINTDLSKVYAPQSAPYTITYPILSDGETVQVTKDGQYLKDQVLPFGGSVDIGSAWLTQVVVGVGYDSVLSPTTVDTNYADGPTQNSNRRVSETRVRVKDTLQLQYGNGVTMDEVDLTPIGTAPGTAFSPVTGVYPLYLPQGSSSDAPIYFKVTKPLPATILSLLTKWEANR